jgi:hypothetical protein
MLKIVMKTIKKRHVGNTNLLKLLPSHAMSESGPITVKNAQFVTPVNTKKLYATETATFVSRDAL